MENPGRAGAILRSEYMIDHHRVVFESGTRWHCACAEFTSFDACRHTREAAGMRSAQAQIRERVSAGRSRPL